MKVKWIAAVFASAAMVAALGTVSDRAEARIVCSNGSQKVQGAWLATPYCQDELVAQVARQYGVSASPNAIRNNPNFKRRVCRLIGQDIRIKETCNEVNPSGRGRF